MLVITLLLTLLFCHHSSRLGHNGITFKTVMPISLAVIPPLFDSPKVLVGASPPIEIAIKLKEKIRKGKSLLEALTDLLENVKDDLKSGKNINKDVVNKLVDLKDKFKKLEVDPGDLAIELIERFKKKTLEAFSLILSSYNLDRIPEVKNFLNQENARKKGDVSSTKTSLKQEKAHNTAEVRKDTSKPLREL